MTSNAYLLAHCCASSGELLRFWCILEFHIILLAHMFCGMFCGITVDALYFCTSCVSGLMAFGAGMQAAVSVTRLKTSLKFYIDSLTCFILTSRHLLTCSLASIIIIELPCLGFCHHHSFSSCFLFLPRTLILNYLYLFQSLHKKGEPFTDITNQSQKVILLMN